LHMVALARRETPVIFIDTAMLFAETLVYQQELAERLDLRDLLVGEEAADADLGSYLSASYDGANTIIEVSSTGGFKGNGSDAGSVDFTITVEGVDLIGDLSGADAIQAMIDAGKLNVDQ